MLELVDRYTQMPALVKDVYPKEPLAAGDWTNPLLLIAQPAHRLHFSIRHGLAFSRMVVSFRQSHISLCSCRT